MKLKLFLFISLVGSGLLAQEKYNLFTDEFNDNSNQWLIGNRGRTNAYITDGLFYLESKRANFNYSRRTEQGYLRSNQDYEISMRIRQVKGDGSRAYAMEWGGSSLINSFYEFWIRKDGVFSIDYFDGRTERFTDFVSWTASSAIKVDDFNLLTVRKEGSRMKFFINEQLVHEMKSLPLLGPEAGFITPPLGAVEVDFLKIDLINERPQPIFDQQSTPKIFVVVVGIADYQNDQVVKDLRFTVNDAQILSNFYQSRNGGGVPKENMLLMINKEATKENILNKTSELFSKAGPNDMIVFYFSGHGDLLKSGSREEELHLIPYNFDRSVESALPISSVESIFNQSLASKKLLMLDACHSGGTLPQLRGRFTNHLASLQDKEVAILTSSDFGETSLEANSIGEGRGLFSYFLTNALIYNSPDCDVNNNGIVSILELFDFVKNGVSKMAREKFYHKQTPQIGGKFNVQLPIAEVSY